MGATSYEPRRGALLRRSRPYYRAMPPPHARFVHQITQVLSGTYIPGTRYQVARKSMPTTKALPYDYTSLLAWRACNASVALDGAADIGRVTKDLGDVVGGPGEYAQRSKRE